MTRQHALIAAVLVVIAGSSAAILVAPRPAASDRSATTAKEPRVWSAEAVRRARIEALLGGFVQAPVSLEHAVSSHDALGERVCGTFHTFRVPGLRGFDVWFYSDGEMYLAVSERKPCPEGKACSRRPDPVSRCAIEICRPAIVRRQMAGGPSSSPSPAKQWQEAALRGNEVHDHPPRLGAISLQLGRRAAQGRN